MQRKLSDRNVWGFESKRRLGRSAYHEASVFFFLSILNVEVFSDERQRHEQMRTPARQVRESSANRSFERERIMSALIADRLLRHVDEGKFVVPPFPEVAQRVTELVSNPEASAASVADLIHKDPGLASELLRYANSSALGGRVEIVSVHQAIVHLGIERVSQVVLSASMRSGVFSAPAYSGLIKHQWRRSVATALASKRIARILAENVEVAFLCGLLWKIGSTLALRGMIEIAKGRRLPSPDEAEVLSEDLNDRFREAATKAWNLPEVVSSALSADEAAGARLAQSSIASLASTIAGQLAEAEPLDIESLTATPEAESLNLYPEQIEELEMQAESFRAELEAMP